MRAAGFFAAAAFAGDFLATVFFAAAFLATVFFAAVFFAAGLLAVAFLATVFFAADFRAAGFFAAGFLAAGFRAAAVFAVAFLADVFLALAVLAAGFLAAVFFAVAGFFLVRVLAAILWLLLEVSSGATITAKTGGGEKNSAGESLFVSNDQSRFTRWGASGARPIEFQDKPPAEGL